MTKETTPSISKEQEAAMKERQALKDEFNHRLNELTEWGFSHGIIIDAYLKADYRGIIPYISFIDMTDEEKKQYEGWKAKMIKEDLELQKQGK